MPGPDADRLELLERVLDATRILKRCNVTAHAGTDATGKMGMIVALSGGSIEEWRVLWSLLELATSAPEPALRERPVVRPRVLPRERL